MDGAADAVLLLEVHLGDFEVTEDGLLLDVSLGRGVDDVLDLEALDGLVLGWVTNISYGCVCRSGCRRWPSRVLCLRWLCRCFFSSWSFMVIIIIFIIRIFNIFLIASCAHCPAQHRSPTRSLLLYFAQLLHNFIDVAESHQTRTYNQPAGVHSASAQPLDSQDDVRLQPQLSLWQQTLKVHSLTYSEESPTTTSQASWANVWLVSATARRALSRICEVTLHPIDTIYRESWRKKNMGYLLGLAET